jgi:hypothetical protein
MHAKPIRVNYLSAFLSPKFKGELGVFAAQKHANSVMRWSMLIHSCNSLAINNNETDAGKRAQNMKKSQRRTT